MIAVISAFAQKPNGLEWLSYFLLHRPYLVLHVHDFVAAVVNFDERVHALGASREDRFVHFLGDFKANVEVALNRGEHGIEAVLDAPVLAQHAFRRRDILAYACPLT